MMKLYVYDHCPFCVKARMIFGLKKIPFEMVILPSDDEKTPISLVGKKVLPILTKEDGSSMPESMDIVAYVDQYQPPLILTGKTRTEIAGWIKEVGSYNNLLLMPRYALAPLADFPTQSARDYFSHKKEAVIGSFAEHLKNSPELINRVNQALVKLEPLLVSDTSCNGELSTDDIHLFAMLRNLSLVKGVHYPARVKHYLDNMSQAAGVNLFTDIAL